MISIGCVIYATLGGLPGAIMFSTGLMCILCCGLNLFTGKAGQLATKEARLTDLAAVFLGNFAGCFLFYLSIALFLPSFSDILEVGTSISSQRIENGFFLNILLGIPCGMLMYAAVSSYKKTGVQMIPFCVAAFILAGFNHCVADMFYFCVYPSWQALLMLFGTMLGNLFGCNIIPLAKRKEKEG